MGYVNAIIRVDFANGSDANLSNLTGVSFTWNSGTSKMRGTFSNHGLTTGQIIQVTGSTGLNDYWKVTVIDSNTFDLDLSPNVANTTGTVIRYRGATWAQAFASFNSANWPFLRAGDEIRVAKTPLVQTNINATWTQGSQNITLPSNSLIRLLNAATSTTGWVAATNVTLSTSSTRKYGSSSLSIATNASFTTGKLAHLTLSSSQDLSSFNTLNLWLIRSSGTIPANSVRVALCSDSNGNTPVDEVVLSQDISYTVAFPLVLRKTALGSNINSIAIYADSSFSSRTILINDIFVSTGLSLLSTVGGSNVPFFSIDGADDTNILLGSHYSTLPPSDLTYGFETTTTALWYYNKVNIDFPVSGNNIDQSIFNSSRSNTELQYRYTNYSVVGGYNTSNDTRDGKTVLTCLPTGSSTTALPPIFALSNAPEFFIGMNFEHFHFNRQQFSNTSYSTNGFYGNYTEFRFKECMFTGAVPTSSMTPIFPMNKVVYENCDFSLRSVGEFLLSDSSSVHSISSVGAPKIFKSCRFNTIRRMPCGNYYFRNCTFGEGSPTLPERIFSYQLDWNAAPRFISCTFQGNLSSYNDSLTNAQSARGASFPACANCSGVPSNYVFTGPCSRALWQTSEKHPNDSGAYEIEVGGFCATGIYHTFRVMQIAASTSTVSVKARVKKNHATNVDVALMVNTVESTAQFAAEPNPVVAADNTSWQELTLNLTPTQAGIIIIEIGYRSSVATNSTTKFFLGSVYA